MRFSLKVTPETTDCCIEMQLDELLKAGDFAGAAAEGEALVKAGSADPLVLNNVAIAQFMNQRPEHALESLGLAVKAAPDLDLSYYNRGRMLLRIGRLEDALSDARKAIALGGKYSAQAQYLLGEILATNKGTRRLAAGAFGAAGSMMPQWAEAHYLAAVNYYNCGDCVAGERWARSAVEAKPDFVDALWLLGQSLLEQDRADEALPFFERMFALAPDAHGLSEEIAKLKATKAAATKRPKPARHPRLTTDYDDFEAFIERYLLTEIADVEPFLTTQSKVFTAGSCFAANIADGLKAQGIDTATVGVPEEINSTYANRRLLEWILGVPTAATEPFERFFGPQQREQFQRSLSSADVVIISLGVAPCFFDRETGDFVITFGSHFYSQQYKFRTTTVQENTDNIKAMVECLLALNPAMKIVLTVSPVPLKGTFEMRSAVVADCVSKSILRVAAHEVLTALPGQVIYWPSFEMVRWYGSHAGPVFGNDDESAFHVSQELVTRILRAFVRHFSV